MNGKNYSLRSNVSGFHRVVYLLLFILLLLASCAPQITDRGRQTADGGPPTATPTPSPTSTPRPTETPTPTPAPPEHPAVFDYAFSRGLIRFDPARDQWLVSAVQTVDGQQTADGGRQTADFILLPDTFATNDELRARNPLAPLTLRALDENSQEMTLIYHPDTAEFRLAPSLPAIYDGVNTESPSFNPEAFDQIPTFTIQDIQSGLAVQSLLVQIQDRLASGESLADILYLDPDAVRKNWQNLGGNSLLFELIPHGKVAWLKAKGNDQGSKTIRYDNLTMKVLPFGAQVEINGQNYFAFYIANFDPLDRENPDPNDLSNWKFFLSIPGYAGNPVNIQDPVVSWADSFQKQKPIFPLVMLYADKTFQQNHPLLSQLLGIEGNDASELGHNPGYLNLQVNIENGMNHLPELRLIETQSLSRPLPPQLQEMIFLFEVGVAQ